MKRALYKKDIAVTLKEVGFEPSHARLAAIHIIGDGKFCITRAREVLSLLNAETKGKRDQVVMAIRLLLLSLILEKE